MQTYRLTSAGLLIAGAAALLLSSSCGDPANTCEESTSRIRWEDRDRYGERPRDYVDPYVDDFNVTGYDFDRDRPIDLRVTLTRRDELVRETQRYPIDGVSRCDDLLEAPVRVRLRGSGNRLDERIVATAEIYPTYPDDPLRVVARFDVDDLEGDWRPTRPAGSDLEGLVLVLYFEGRSVTGELLVELYDRERERSYREQAFLIGSDRP